MEKEKFSLEDINQMGDLRIEDTIKSVIEKNQDIVKLIYDYSDKENLEENFVAALFSNLKFKIVESLAVEMGIDNPKSKEAWQEVTKKYPLEELEKMIKEIARKEFKTWNYRQHETSH